MPRAGSLRRMSDRIGRLGVSISELFRRTAPDPLVLAILLTTLTAVLALLFGWRSPELLDQGWVASRGAAITSMLDGWRGDSGLWRLLAFGMQMCLVLVAGHAVAAAPPVKRVLVRLASIPTDTAGAVVLVSVTACLAGLINWGFGLVAGAILAREVGRAFASRGRSLHYPIVCAAGYTTMLLWHGGLSGSAPLTVSNPGDAARTMGADAAARLVGDGIPLWDTLLSPLNVLVTGGLLVLVPLTLRALVPRDERLHRQPPALEPPALEPPANHSQASGSEPIVDAAAAPTIAERLDRSRILAWLSALVLGIALVRFAAVDGVGAVGLNQVNALMLALGVALHGSLRSWMAAIEDGARGCAGIIVQFPLYGGIMAMLIDSGLARDFVRMLVEIAPAPLLPTISFISAAVVNLFVPSGGGQWAIQGAIALDAGASAGVRPGTMVMSVAYGDQLTNMLQPFWALPLLAITRVRAAEIVGYTAIVMVVAALWIGSVLVVAGALQT